MCIYVQSRDNFDCLYFFVVSFYPFFLFGEKKDSMEYLFRGTKKQSSSSSKKWRLSREKLDSLFFTRFIIKPLPPVLLVFKKDDDDDFDDDNALSSV